MPAVRFFASLREAAGRSLDECAAATVGELLKALKAKHGEEFGRSLRFAKIAVNGVLIDELQGHATPLRVNDVVALLPPVSGGECQ